MRLDDTITGIAFFRHFLGVMCLHWLCVVSLHSSRRAWRAAALRTVQQAGSHSLPVCLDQHSLPGVAGKPLLLHLIGGCCELLQHVYDSTWQEPMMQLQLHQVHLNCVMPDKCHNTLHAATSLAGAHSHAAGCVDAWMLHSSTRSWLSAVVNALP